MVVVDCLTLWLTQRLMPPHGPGLPPTELCLEVDGLLAALREAPGPVVCVSNEIGLGLSPMSPEARGFVDELGRLHQRVAAQSGQVTLLVAGIEWPIKRCPPGT
jgi:adenosylcobinamide kinase/adenosylcobinamide-phosphate guanylyltransferase